ncbi:multidrug effflux MFS transporter [Pseudomonadota bacterium]
MITNPPKGLIFIIAMLAMIGPFSIDTYLPSFPTIEEEFGVDRALLSQSIALYLGAFAISALVGGPLADSFGRRPLIIGSLLIYVVASLGCAIAPTYTLFMCARLVQGVGAGICLVVGRTITRDVYDFKNAQRVMSHIMLTSTLAPAIAPIIGGELHEVFGWRGVFYFLCLFGLGLLALFYSKVPESLVHINKKTLHPKNIGYAYFTTLTHIRFIFLTLIMTCISGGLFIYLVGTPTIIFDFLNLGTTDFYIIFIPVIGAMSLGAWISGQLAHRLHVTHTINFAFSIMMVASLINMGQAVWIDPSVHFTIAPLIIFSFGIGIAGPVLMLMSIDCLPANRSTASGVLGFVQTLGHALLSSLILPILIYPSYMALGQLTLVSISLILWLKLSVQKNISEVDN